MTMTLDRVPLLNLQDLDRGPTRETFIRAFGDGLRDYGFVKIEGHGIDPGLIREVYALFARFFALDAGTKLGYEVPGGNQRGYTRMGKEHAKDTPVGDLKEFWHVGREVPGYPPNIWPLEVPELQRAALALFSALEDCARTMLRALDAYFELPEGHLAGLIEGGNSILRAIHYPPVPPDADPRAVRASAHEDINFITLLCEASASGLEILTREGRWLPIDALGGQIVVDSGDMLSRITNGVIPATTHRVVNPSVPGGSPEADASNVRRYSLPFFVHPHPDALLECLPGCRGPELSPPPASIRADDFLRQRLREIGLL